MTNQRERTPADTLAERIEWHLTRARCEIPDSTAYKHEEQMINILCKKYHEMTGKHYVANYVEASHS